MTAQVRPEAAEKGALTIADTQCGGNQLLCLLKNTNTKAGEIAVQLRALVELAEDLGSILSTHLVTQNYL